MTTSAAVIEHLCRRLGEVQQRLGSAPNVDPDAPFADLVDSMGLVEFLGLLAGDCAVRPEAIEQAAGRRFSTLTDLAKALTAAGIAPRPDMSSEIPANRPAAAEVSAWLLGVKGILPREVQTAVQLDRLLNCPVGWLERHAGIRRRHVWAAEDALEATARMASSCLHESAVDGKRLAALLVTSEAPPRPLGVATALHARMGLPPEVPALEVGGACTGLVHCLWLGRRLVRPGAAVLVVALEAASTWLEVQPGPAGETAALFGDGAGACLLTAAPVAGGWPVSDVVLGCDGGAAELIRVRADGRGAVVEMDGPALALRAVQQLAAVVEQVCGRHGLKATDLEGVFVHAGNGRLPALVARQLGVPVERVRSTTEWTGNLGSVSLLAALAHQLPLHGPAVCAAVGAGLCWGGVLIGPARSA